MKLRKLLEQMEPLTVKQAKELLVSEGCYNEEDIDEYTIEPKELHTMYNDYPCVGDYTYVVIKDEDYKDYCKDLSMEMGQKLPDSFEKYFNDEALYEDMLRDETYIFQTQRFFEQLGDDIDIFESVIPSDNCYVVELK